MTAFWKKIQKIQNLHFSFWFSCKIAITNSLTSRKWKVSIFKHPSYTIKGYQNIIANNLWLGLHYRGYEHKADNGVLNIKGRLQINGFYKIARGCRIDVAENAKLSIGNGGYMNSNTVFIITDYMNIGDKCAISWNCQFLDNDFHTIHINQKEKTSREGINIGNNVWIGCNVKVYKGVIIPNGCVVASDSVVKDKFYEENCLIAGNPAKVIKTNISWK